MKKINTNRYVCVAVDHSIIEASTKADGTEKAPSVAVTLRVVEGPDAGLEVYWYGSLKEGQAQEITAKTLRAMGWNCNDITALTGLGDLKVALVGSEGEYMGKPQQRWNVWEIKTPAPRLAEESKASFADRYKALGVSVPVVTRSEANEAPENIPAPLARNGTGATAGATDGPPGGSAF